MGYGFARARGAQQETIGLTAATGVTVTSGTAGNFGSLATIGTTGFAYDGLILSFSELNSRRWRISLAANSGGGDEIIADSIAFAASSLGNQYTGQFDLPIRVPSGATLKVKAAEQIGASTAHVSVCGYGGGAARSQGFSRIVSLTDFTGADPTNTITLSGATLSGWVQVAASSPADVGFIWACPTDTSGGTRSNQDAYIEIGWGASGSETSLFKVPYKVSTNFSMQPFGLPCMLKAGTRIAARALCSIADTHTVGVVCWGAQP